MKKYIYPVIFEKEGTDYLVSVPDFPEISTEGGTFEEAYDMAIDAIGLTIDYRQSEGLDIPAASALKDVKVGKDQEIALVGFDFSEYLRRTDSKAVKKTLSIPAWLNHMAIEQGINFSQVLQEALKEKVGQ